MAGDILDLLSMSGNPTLGGNAKIEGYVDRLAVVGRYKVRLYNRSTGAFLGQTWSSSTGYYQFVGIPLIIGGFTLIAFDHNTPRKKPGISDPVSSELMA